MPVQQQMSSFAKKYAARVAQANTECKDKPVDTGNRRLPSGIRDGIAKLSTMYTKEQTEDNAKTPKGESFFRASAIVVYPTEHGGQKVEGLVTQRVVPLCDVPAKGQRKAETFEKNYEEMQNIIRMCGVDPCPHVVLPGMTEQQRIAVGMQAEAYWFAAMKMLTDPVRTKANPIYLTFSTRGWTPPATPQQPKPEEMVFEEWHGLATPEQVAKIGQFNPAAGVQNNGQPPPPAAPPTQTSVQQGAAPPPVSGPPPQHQPEESDPADKVAYLVEVAMNDPEGATQEGMDASAQLEQMAWDAGWSKDQTAGAADWGAVGEMALNPPDKSPTTPPQNDVGTVVVGGRWMYAKRTKDGEKLKNGKGEPFPPQEVEVTSVDAAAKTCTVKTIKDGKDVVDIRTKKPVAVKFEWLEQAPPY